MAGQQIQFFKGEVTLEIYLNDDLTSQGKDWASIVVDTGMIGSKPKYWDNMRFFLENEEKFIKKTCKPDVKEMGLKWKEVYADIKFLIDRAQKIRLLVGMGKTFKHKLKGKYHSKALDYIENPPPIELQKMWDRSNWDIGEARRDKKLKRIKDLDKNLKDDLCTHQEI